MAGRKFTGGCMGMMRRQQLGAGRGAGFFGFGNGAVSRPGYGLGWERCLRGCWFLDADTINNPDEVLSERKRWLERQLDIITAQLGKQD